jgi:flagellar capping protein FliD
MNSEIDVNLLVSVYNEKINSLTSQNILLEARLKSLIKDYTEEKNKLLMANLELQRKLDSLEDKPSANSKKVSKTETSDFE